MTAIEQITNAQKATLVDEDGEPVRLELTPALEADQIDSLEKDAGQPLPEELRLLLSFCSGIDGCLDGIDFTGRDMAFEQKEVFPNGIPIARDGFGNFWVLDLTPQTTKIAPVFFACHDAPVILYQSSDIASFLSDVFRMSTPPHKSLVNDVHEDRLFDVCGRIRVLLISRLQRRRQIPRYEPLPRHWMGIFRLWICALPVRAWDSLGEDTVLGQKCDVTDTTGFSDMRSLQRQDCLPSFSVGRMANESWQPTAAGPPVAPWLRRRPGPRPRATDERR